MVITCSKCGNMAYGGYYPTSVRSDDKPWGVADYDAYKGPIYCSETCRHADDSGPAPRYPGQ